MGSYFLKKAIWNPPNLFKIPIISLDKKDPIKWNYSENLFSTQATICCNEDNYNVIGNNIILNDSPFGKILLTKDAWLYGEEQLYQIEIGSDIIQISIPDNTIIEYTVRLNASLLGKCKISPFLNPIIMNLTLNTYIDKYIEIQLLTLFIYIRDFWPEGTFVGG